MEELDKKLKERWDSLLENVYGFSDDDWDDVIYEDTINLLDDIDPEQFVESINEFMESGDDELEIEYGDGESIILDRTIVEKLVDNYSEDELLQLAESATELNRAISDLFDDDILDIEEDDE